MGYTITHTMTCPFGSGSQTTHNPVIPIFFLKKIQRKMVLF